MLASQVFKLFLHSPGVKGTRTSLPTQTQSLQQAGTSQGHSPPGARRLRSRVKRQGAPQELERWPRLRLTSNPNSLQCLSDIQAILIVKRNETNPSSLQLSSGKKKKRKQKLVSSCKSQHTDAKNINPIYPAEDALPVLLALFTH